MNGAATPVCTICGEEKSGAQTWFLVAEDRWADKLKVLQWHDQLARRRNIHHACCALHVQELVVHWMTTGSLDYPFAAGSSPETSLEQPESVLPPTSGVNARGVRLIGELTVHRESVGRALSENPESLQVILDELFDALERAATGAETDLEFEEDEMLLATRAV